MMHVRIIFSGCILYLFAGCVTVKTTAEFDAGVNFATLRTWDWKPGVKASLGDPRIDDERIDRGVRGAVSRYLIGAGYVKATREPDFLVSYFASLEEKFETSPADTLDREDAEHSERPAGAIRLNKIRDKGLSYEPNPPPVYEYEYETGTLVVDLLDPRTGRRLWRGKAVTEVDRQKPPEEKAQKILEAAHKIISQFPPPSGR